MTRPKEITFVHAMNEAVHEEMRNDKSVMVFGTEVELSYFGATAGCVTEFGKDRVIATPLSESGFMGMAVGAAARGLKMIVEGLNVGFCLYGMDQLLNNAAKMRYKTSGQAATGITFLFTYGSNPNHPSQGCQHHQCLYSLFMHVPGLKIIVPSTPYDAKGLLKTAVRGKSPCLFFYHAVFARDNSAIEFRGAVPKEEYTIPFGKAAVRREGSDATVVAVGFMLIHVMKAAETLAQQGVSVEVIDPRTLVPLDKEAVLKSVKKTGRLIVVDEAHKTCGLASEISAIVAEEGYSFLKAPIKRVTSPDIHIPAAKPLLDNFLPNEDKVVSAVKELM